MDDVGAACPFEQRGYTTNTAQSAILGAAAQAWPPFALVAGLLLVGQVAAEDGAFAAVGSRIAARRLPPQALLAALLGLVALVTAVLNLDTAAVFLTPLLLHVARSAGLDERPFLYGTVLMSNSASLLLPGSNLTNLMVLAGARMPGGEFARHMLGPWLAAVGVTGLVVGWAYRHTLRRGPRPEVEVVQLRGRLGVGAAGLAALLVLALPDPAPAILALGLGVATWRARRDAPRAVARALGGWRLAALLAVVVLVGSGARAWHAPGVLTGFGDRWPSACAGTVAAVLLNNLPAAALLGAHAPAHPLFLLVGLDLGPNLGVSGSLSAVLWLQAARHAGARPSLRTYSTLGAAVVLLAVPLSTAWLIATSTP